jgi:hypothetical protein
MGNQRNGDRRRENDRRQSGDRRRLAEGRTAVFELCRSQLNFALIVESGDTEKVITRSIRWRNSATTLHSEQGALELTEAFRTLVSEERLAGAKTRISLGGEYCVTRVVTGPTDEVRKEIAALEDRSLRYLTLGPGRKSLSRCFQQLDARHQHAMLTVTSQRTLDLVMEIAAKVGLHIESIEPSLIALSRAQANLENGSRDACLIIQLDEAAAELGICYAGRLLLDYRPGGNTVTDNIADVVGQHLIRLQRYLNRYHDYLNAPLKDVYLTGEPRAVELARQRFASLGQLEVHVLDPGDLRTVWQHVGEKPGTQVAAVLGTALTLQKDTPTTPSPNMIEGTLAQMREPLRPVLLRSLAPLAAVALIAATIWVLHLANLRQIAALNAEMKALEPEVARATEMRLQLLSAEAKLAQLANLERKLQQPDWQRLLTRVSQSMPDDVWLERLVVRDGHSATLGGASFSDGGVYDFVNHLKDVPDIAEISLEGTGVNQSQTGPTTTFDLKATLASFNAHGSEGKRDE